MIVLFQNFSLYFGFADSSAVDQLSVPLIN